jgi:transposase
MDVVHERCCGLDVHKKLVVACLLVSDVSEPGRAGPPRKEIRRFGTMTEDLEALAAWLAQAGCSAVALESTGSYWQPIWNVLEERGFTVLLVNPQHIKQVPGRKTDVKDCEWIADLLRHGLLRGSFVPDAEQRQWRDLTRYRHTLVQERTAEVNRLQKVLEGANIKLAAVATDVLGKSGREMLEALVQGTSDPKALADLARGRLRSKIPQLERALSGRFGAHQRFLIARQLAHIDALDELIADLDAQIAERLRPFDAVIDRLDTIPGVGRRTAEVIVAEIGPEVSRFASAAQLASWAGLCPGNHESAGKRKSGKTRRGNRYLRAALIEAANAAARTKTYVAAQYHRLVPRRGQAKASVAVAHTLLVIAYHLLKEPGMVYQDLGVRYFDERDRAALERRAVARLEALGFKVSLEPVEPPAA